ncbi:MAG: DUF6011 domain-containing protein [Tardiphaga sp.]
MTNDDFNDDLSDLLGKARGPIAQPKTAPVQYVPMEKRFEEGCPKCHGTGRFRSWGGRDLGACFNCKGAGKKVFKTSPESRAKARTSNVVKAEQRAKQLLAEIEAWKAAHPQAYAWLLSKVDQPGQDFATSLYHALRTYGSLTDNQLAAVERNVAKAAERKAEREAAAPAVDATKIEQAFAVAREKAARPGQIGTFEKPLKLTSPDNVTVSFRPGSIGSQWEGMLFAKSADGKKLGSIKGGKFFRRFECTDAEEAAVTACASDPEKAVVAYAKAFGRCGVCGAQLLNDVSIARGIGPICAAKFGW